VKGVLLLSWRRVRHQRAQTAILVGCLTLTAVVPLAAARLVSSWETGMRSRAAATPLVCGARGSPLDLTLAALYLRDNDLEPLPWAAVAELSADARDLAIPLHRSSTARGLPIVATTPEYYAVRGLVPASGTSPLRLGECALGSAAARELGLGTGDSLFSDQRELYDLSVPPALKMRITGVFAETGTPDDGAVFTDVGTAWILEGLSHGHRDARAADPSLVMGASGERVVLSPALVADNEVNPENAADYHLHADRSSLPLTAVLVFPADEKAGTILRSRINAAGLWQLVAPASEVEELFAVVFRVKAIFDAVSAVLLCTTLALLLLVALLSMKIRAREMETLHRIGCPRGTSARLYATELLLVLGAAGALARLVTVALAAWSPDLSRLLA
jgi:putative ABC transport system permease protein